MGPQKTQLPPAPGEFDSKRLGMNSDVGDTSLSEAVATLRKRRWILILAGVLGLAYGSYTAFTQPKVFVATSVIQVHNAALPMPTNWSSRSTTATTRRPR